MGTNRFNPFADYGRRVPGPEGPGGSTGPAGPPGPPGPGGVGGSGTGGNLPIWTGSGPSTTLGDSIIDYGDTTPGGLTSINTGAGGTTFLDVSSTGAAGMLFGAKGNITFDATDFGVDGSIGAFSGAGMSLVNGGSTPHGASISFENDDTGGIQFNDVGGGGIALIGNTAVSGTLKTAGRIKGLNIQTASYATVATDEIVQMNAAGANTLTLENSVAAIGQVYTIKNVGAGVCTVQASSGNIDSHASIALVQWQALEVYWDGTLWHQLSQSFVL